LEYHFAHIGLAQRYNSRLEGELTNG